MENPTESNTPVETAPVTLDELFNVSMSPTVIDLEARYPDTPVYTVCTQQDDSGDTATTAYSILAWTDTTASLMSSSPICRRLAKEVDTATLLALATSASVRGIECVSADAPRVIIVVFPEPEDYLAACDGAHYIESIGDFYHFVQFADKYMLHMATVCARINMTIWLLTIREQQKEAWRENAILLSPIEEGLMSKPKFGQAGAARAVPVPYPVGRGATVTAPRYITMRDIKSTMELSADELHHLMGLLIAAGCQAFVDKMIAIYGTSIMHYDVMVHGAPVEYLMSSVLAKTVLFYAFRLMYLEEISMYHRGRGPGRFIMDLDTIAKLPYIHCSFKHSPYRGTLSRHAASTSLELPCRLTGKRGVYTLETFKRRMTTYTGGIFKYITWSGPHHKTALNGSLITACAIVNPLEEACSTASVYFNEYYPARSRYVYSRSTGAQRTGITVRAGPLYEDEADDEAPTVDPVTPMGRHDNVAPADDGATDDAPKVQHTIDYTDIDVMIECTMEMFDKVADDHYAAICRAAAEAGMPTPTLEYVTTENKHKYIIKGLPRDIDLFHVDSIAGVVVKYHGGWVRAWYDGDNVWCFPTFATAALTGMSIDLRWTSNRKDVRDIVLKYFQRGFGTLINNTDRRLLIDYINASTIWPHLTAPANRWRANRYWNAPLFHNVATSMFNPSVSRYGIHAHLETPQHQLYIDVNKQERRAKEAKQHMAEYMGLRGTFRLPAQCDSLAQYM